MISRVPGIVSSLLVTAGGWHIIALRVATVADMQMVRKPTVQMFPVMQTTIQSQTQQPQDHTADFKEMPLTQIGFIQPQSLMRMVNQSNVLTLLREQAKTCRMNILTIPIPKRLGIKGL